MTYRLAGALTAAAAVALTVGGLALQTLRPAAAHDARHHRGPATLERPELSIGRRAAYDYDPPEPGSYRLPALKEAADGVVLDETGDERSLRDLLGGGKVTVLSFIYTRCSDVCPLATLLLHQIHGFAAEDPGLRDRLRLITISFDPEHDTPEVMAAHAEALADAGGEPAAEWRFLTTSGRDALAPILAAYGQPVGLKSDPADPLGPFAHQLRVYLIDRDARIRNIYSLGFLDPRLVMTDVRTLLLEAGREVAGR